MSDLIQFGAPWSGRVLVTAVVLVALLGAALCLCWRRRRTEPRCAHCGYSMAKAVSSRCPECGENSTAEEQLRGPRRWRPALVCVAVALLVPGLVAGRRMRQYGWDYYLTFGPGHYFFGQYTVDRVRISGQYVRIRADRSPRIFAQVLDVRGKGLRETIEGFRWTIGADAGNGRTIGRGEDITGNGRPNIVAWEWSGGAHCCMTYYIYEVSAGGDLVEVARIEAKDGGSFEDVDADGWPEFVLCDWSWAYRLNCFACLDYPEVVLKFDGSTFAPCPGLMFEAEPEPAHVERWIEHATETALQARDINRMRDWMWSEMLRLIYVGHAGVAWRLYDAAWREEWGSKAQNLAEFRTMLEQSPYFPVVIEVNGGSLE